MKLIRFVHCFILFLAVTVVYQSECQTVTGNIVGTVTDTTGAVIPGAHVVAKNMGTGVESSTITDKAGVYHILYLPTGQYQVTISAAGFTTQIFPPFNLVLDNSAKVNAQLKVGSATTNVAVTASSAQLLDTNDATLGLVMSSQEIDTIPLNGENFSSVTLYQPGAIDTAPQGLTGNNAVERDNFNSDIPTTNGNRSQDNNYMIEGIPMNQIGNNLIGYNPAPEAIQQMKVISANGSSQYGDANGGNTLVELKSGTNQFHGSAYGHLENQDLDANTWGNKDQRPIIPRNPFTQTIFGGTLGGPILHHKLFFFGDYEGVRLHNGGIGSASVLTPAMRKGDFSALLNPPSTGPTFTPIQLYDTQNGFTPYPNNQIPILNPLAQSLVTSPLYPLPNAAPVNGIIQNNFQGPQNSFIVNNQWDVKFEWDPRNADKITGFYSDSQPYDAGHLPILLEFPNTDKYPTHVAGGSWSHIFSPELVNLVHAGFTRVNWINKIPYDPSGQFGYTGDAKLDIPLPYAQEYQGFTAQFVSGATQFGTAANVQVIADNQFYYNDDLTWQHGQHMFSMGVQALRYQENYLSTGNSGFLGRFTYTGAFTSNPNVPANGVGFGPADFLLDDVEEAAIAENGGTVGGRQWRLSGYFQDDWRIRPTLTFNLGIRYEYDEPWYEVNNKAANVVLSGPNKGLVEYAVTIPEGAPAGAILCPNRACYNPNWDQIMPRLGFAWQIKPQFVLRGGYGSTSDFEGDETLSPVPPYQKAFDKVALLPTKTSGGTPYTVASGFSSVPGSPFYSTNAGFGAMTPNIQPQYVQQWNLTAAYAFTTSTSLSVGYVGEAGSHLLNYMNANELPYAGAPAPFENLVGEGGGLFETMSEAMMDYNALQATFRQTYSKGSSFTLNYTWAKSLTDSTGFYGTNISGNDGAAQNGYDPAADYGPNSDDIRNSVSAIGAYALPFGRGQKFGSSVSGPLNQVIGGWRISGSAVVYSGYPIEMNSPSENNVHSYGQARANQYRPLKIRNRSLTHWWGTDPSAIPCTAPGVDNGLCAYGVPAVNTFGTAKVNTERTDGYRQVDASIFKDFHVTGTQLVTFRADIFNLFNLTSYGNPVNNVSNPNFGLVTSVKSPPRQIQLNLVYTF